MRNLLVLTAVLMLVFVAAESTFAQASAVQNVTLAVNPIYRISVSGDPGPLTITSGSAGNDDLTPVTDNSTTYSITQNVGNTLKITGEIDVALATGYTLEINLASNKGSSAGNVDISTAVSGSAVDLVTAIGRGADQNQTILYTFSADASAGDLPATTKIVTLTLTN
jgi:hypothetical protein